MYEVVMPRLSDSMEEGTIIRWLKADGDEVRRGEDLVEIETDKATMTYESDADGTLSISVAAGESVAVGSPIAVIGEAGAAPAPAAQPPATSAAGSTPAGAGTALAAAPAVAAAPARNGQGVSASPVARRMAARLSVDLLAVTGSGPHGRILKADVVKASQASAAPQPAAAPAAPAPAPADRIPAAQPTAASVDGGRKIIQELTRTQTVIARRMSESRATVPDFSLEVDVDMTAALALRAQLKEIADPAPSLNDIVVKACAVALGRHPRANGSYRDGRFELHESVNVGIAVAADDALVVPVVRDAAGKSLGAIAAETRQLAARVRSREVTPAELSGGTFTVSNLGMYGIDRFEGIINVPQAAILCVGAIRERPVVVDGEVVARPMMTITLACDHRILYGADAAQLLADIRGYLEQPLAIAL